MKKEISGDFISDHPAIVGWLGLGILSAVLNLNSIEKTSKQDASEREFKKNILRREKLKEYPFQEPGITDEFYQFAFGRSLEELSNREYKDIIKMWNNRHTGIFYGYEYKLLIDDSPEYISSVLKKAWQSSTVYQELLTRLFQLHIQEIDRLLILEGKI